MIFNNNNIDIAKNIRIIETLKSDLLSGVSELFKSLSSFDKENIHEHVIDIIASLILASYLLSKRLGISYDLLQLRIQKKIKIGILENNDVEKYYSELTTLSGHLKNKNLF